MHAFYSTFRYLHGRIHQHDFEAHFLKPISVKKLSRIRRHQQETIVFRPEFPANWMCVIEVAQTVWIAQNHKSPSCIWFVRPCIWFADIFYSLAFTVKSCCSVNEGSDVPHFNDMTFSFPLFHKVGESLFSQPVWQVRKIAGHPLLIPILKLH